MFSVRLYKNDLDHMLVLTTAFIHGDNYKVLSTQVLAMLASCVGGSDDRKRLQQCYDYDSDEMAKDTMQ